MTPNDITHRSRVEGEDQGPQHGTLRHAALEPSQNEPKNNSPVFTTQPNCIFGPFLFSLFMMVCFKLVEREGTKHPLWWWLGLKCQEFAWLPWCCAVQICGCLSVWMVLTVCTCGCLSMWMVLAVCTCCSLPLMIGHSCSLCGPCHTSSRKVTVITIKVISLKQHHKRDINRLEFHPKELALHVLQIYVCALLQIMHQVVSVCPVALWYHLADFGKTNLFKCAPDTLFLLHAKGAET